MSSQPVERLVLARCPRGRRAGDLVEGVGVLPARVHQPLGAGRAPWRSRRRRSGRRGRPARPASRSAPGSRRSSGRSWPRRDRGRRPPSCSGTCRRRCPRSRRPAGSACRRPGRRSPRPSAAAPPAPPVRSVTTRLAPDEAAVKAAAEPAAPKPTTTTSAVSSQVEISDTSHGVTSVGSLTGPPSRCDDGSRSSRRRPLRFEAVADGAANRPTPTRRTGRAGPGLVGHAGLRAHPDAVHLAPRASRRAGALRQGRHQPDRFPTLPGEAERMIWAAPYLPVPDGGRGGRARRAAVLLTEALPGRDGTDPAWRRRPARAGRALRARAGRVPRRRRRGVVPLPLRHRGRARARARPGGPRRIDAAGFHAEHRHLATPAAALADARVDGAAEPRTWWSATATTAHPMRC